MLNLFLVHCEIHRNANKLYLFRWFPALQQYRHRFLLPILPKALNSNSSAPCQCGRIMDEQLYRCLPLLQRKKGWIAHSVRHFACDSILNQSTYK